MAYKDKKDQAEASKRHYEANKRKIKKRSFLRNKSQRHKNKSYVDAIKSISECVDCGESNPLVLDFDHVKGKKVKCISDMVRCSYSIDTIKKEIDKCELRCSNCHRVITDKRRDDKRKNDR
tara:strand:- start:200 stop:562 length:363 start_codon:yes stop_codon:yes gene_type:complete